MLYTSGLLKCESRRVLEHRLIRAEVFCRRRLLAPVDKRSEAYVSNEAFASVQAGIC